MQTLENCCYGQHMDCGTDQVAKAGDDIMAPLFNHLLI